jgi:hypothetical protein
LTLGTGRVTEWPSRDPTAGKKVHRACIRRWRRLTGHNQQSLAVVAVIALAPNGCETGADLV